MDAEQMKALNERARKEGTFDMDLQGEGMVLEHVVGFVEDIFAGVNLEDIAISTKDGKLIFTLINGAHVTTN